MEAGTGFPGYNTMMPRAAARSPKCSSRTATTPPWYGKNHNVPDWQTSQAGPFDLWPTGLGFEYFYGFIGGGTNQWAPAIFENIKPIEPPHDAKDYFFDKDMADHCIDRIRLLHAVAPAKPWLRYYAPGHVARAAPRAQGLDRQVQGQVRSGLGQAARGDARAAEGTGRRPQDTKLTPRSAGIGAWDELDADHKKVYAP
jgi:arylsulfatase